MMIIGEVLVEKEVLEAEFACDLAKCHGACCTLEGGRGAPLLDEEVGFIEKHYPVIEQYLPAEHRAVIAEAGLVDGEPGNYATVCVGSRACVFVYYEGPVAKCAYERAYNAGETDWRKPLSCHLFPVRVRPGAPRLVRYEEINECRPGRTAGEAGSVPLHEFLRTPLERAFGPAWYDNLREGARRNGNDRHA